MLEPKDLLGLAAGLVGVASAWLAYKTKVRESQTRKETKQVVLAIGSAESVPTKWVRWKYLTFAIVALVSIAVAGLLFLGAGPQVLDLTFWLSLTIGFVVVVSTALIWDRLRPASVRYETDVVVALEAGRAIEAALASARQLGTEVDYYESASLKLAGRIPWHKALFFGSKLIYVQVVPLSSERSQIKIVCDAPNPFARFDFGSNRRLARRLVNNLLAA